MRPIPSANWRRTRPSTYGSCLLKKPQAKLSRLKAGREAKRRWPPPWEEVGWRLPQDGLPSAGRRTGCAAYICRMATHLQQGQRAPAFTGIDQDGKKVSLADFKGQKLVLFFYPEDDTPTCTVQACNLRDNYGLLRQNGFQVLGVSPNTGADHQKFKAKFSLPFPLLADPGRKIIDKYGVWGLKKLYGREYEGLHRTTFVIDENGFIQKIFLRPKNKAHAEEILR